jgi:hypothetical protein
MTKIKTTYLIRACRILFNPIIERAYPGDELTARVLKKAFLIENKDNIQAITLKITAFTLLTGRIPAIAAPTVETTIYHERRRQQVILMFKPLKKKGKDGKSNHYKYLHINHFDENDFNKIDKIEFKAGKYGATYKLKDNSKIVVYADSEDAARALCGKLADWTKKDKRYSGSIRDRIATCQRIESPDSDGIGYRLVRAELYPTGDNGMKPTKVKFF